MKYLAFLVLSWIQVFALNSAFSQTPEDPVQILKKFGPDANMVDRKVIESGIKMLQWQQELIEAQLRQLTELQSVWRTELEALNQEIFETGQKINEAGLDANFDGQDLAEFAQRKLETHIALKSLMVKREALTKSLSEYRASHDANVATLEKLELKYYADVLANLEQQGKKLDQLFSSGHISEGELHDHRLRITEAKLHLDQSQAKLSQKPSEIVGLEQELLALTAQIAEVEQTYQSLQTCLTSNSASVARISLVKRRRAFLEQQLERSDQEILSIRLRNTEAAALLELCVKASPSKETK